MKRLEEALLTYRPVCEQEEEDRLVMLRFLRANPDCLTRDNPVAHFTASSWIVNPSADKVLMVYHNIYQSWSWTGGHADGEEDLLSVALREAQEETGLCTVRPLKEEPVSLEIITVDGHEKRGAYVPSHLHLNLTFLLTAEETQPLLVKSDENSGVDWIPVSMLENRVSEPWMMARIYEKLRKVKSIEFAKESKESFNTVG